MQAAALQDDHIPTSVVLSISEAEWEHLVALGSFEPFPFRLLIAFAATFPVNGDGLNCSTSSVCSAVPLRGAIVSMGLRGSPWGLRGEIEIFPGPPAKRL